MDRNQEIFIRITLSVILLALIAMFVATTIRMADDVESIRVSVQAARSDQIEAKY